MQKAITQLPNLNPDKNGRFLRVLSCWPRIPNINHPKDYADGNPRALLKWAEVGQLTEIDGVVREFLKSVLDSIAGGLKVGHGLKRPSEGLEQSGSSPKIRKVGHEKQKKK
jgi:hypothetical protein